jgi:hypothetical protein
MEGGREAKEEERVRNTKADRKIEIDKVRDRQKVREKDRDRQKVREKDKDRHRGR